MADIVSTLFGLPPLDNRELEQQARTRDIELGTLYGNATMNPYGDATAEQLYAKQQASQFALGGAAGRAIGGLFGLKTPEQKRAADIQGVMKQTQEEVGSSNPVDLYPAMAKRLADMGYSEEAFKVSQAGHQARMEQGKTVGDMSYKQSMMMYYKQLGETQQATQEAKLMELHGQIANGALTQYRGAQTPEVKDQIWQAALQGLKAKGKDVMALADLPESEREKALEGIIDSAETSTTRVKAEIAASTLAMKETQFKEKMAMEETKNSLRMAIANLQAEMKQYAADSATARAMQTKVDTFGNQLKLLTIKEANDTQAGFASAIGTKEFAKDIDSYLRDTVGLTDKDQIRSARTEFSTVYREFLGRKNPEGYPLYSNTEALNKAKQYVEEMVGTESTWYGKEKPKFDAKSKPSKEDPLGLRKK